MLKSNPAEHLFHIALCLVLVSTYAWLSACNDSGCARPLQRAFIPGVLGEERPVGLRIPACESPVANHDSRLADQELRKAFSNYGFTTRAFTGLRGPAGTKWGRDNQLTPGLEFSHNLGYVVPSELLATRPEFFPLVEGKRLNPAKGIFYWNPDIARSDLAVYAARKAREFFAEKFHEPSFALGVNDALIWGESPELRALATPTRWFRERPDYSDVVFTFMNRAAEELNRTHPDKYLGALAYYWCENLPSFPLHPQVIPFLTADRSQGYDPEFWREEMELQRKWGEVAGRPRAENAEMGNAERLKPGIPKIAQQLNGGGAEVATAAITNARMVLQEGTERAEQNAESGNAEKPTGKGGFQNFSGSDFQDLAASSRRLGLYDYLYGGGFLIPRTHTQYISEHLRHAWRVGFTDYFAEVNPNWGLDGPMPWLVAQLLSDPEQPVEPLLDEYYTRYFREAHAPMRRFFERCEELWMQQPGPSYWLKHYRNESQAIVFPSSVLPELRGYLDEARARAKSTKIRARVVLVSDTFGVTERFVRFKEAKDALIAAALRGDRKNPEKLKAENLKWESAADAGKNAEIERTENVKNRSGLSQHFSVSEFQHLDLESLLSRYIGLRREFISYTRSLQRSQPLALYPFGWDDYLKNDPVPLARAALEPELVASATRGLLVDAAMAGVVQPKRMIADLTYGVALPAPWISKVEPTQHHEAGLVGPARALRISGTKDTMVQQWAAVRGPGRHVAEFGVRGKVSPGTAVQLVFAFLDANAKHAGFKSVRLPDGEWPEFVTLRQFADAPANAKWVGVGIRVQNQVTGDWVEARGFTLRY